MASNRTLMVVLGWTLAGAALAQTPPTAPVAAPAPAAAVRPPIPAAPPPADLPHGSGPTLGDLDRIQGQVMMAQAQLQLAQAQQSLAKEQGTAAPLGGASTLSPVVAGVFGQAKAPYAKFILGDGGETIGRAGDVLPGDFKVLHVGIDKVSIRDKAGHVIVARFASPSAPGGAGGDTTRADMPPLTPDTGANAGMPSSGGRMMTGATPRANGG